jgi:hypothetical protein
MSEDVQDEHTFRFVIDPRDQPVVVAMDVEHSPAAHDVRVREVTSYIGQRAPGRSPGDPLPVHQRDQRIPMLFGKLKNGWFVDQHSCEFTSCKLMC